MPNSPLEDRRVVGLIEEVEKILTPEEFQLLKELVDLSGDTSTLIDQLQGIAMHDYRWRPVDMETFIRDPDYLGMDGNSGRGSIYPKLLDDLVELFEGDYNVAYLYGGIGTGKSTFCEVAIARMLYDLACFKSPQVLYGLRDASPIAVLNVSVNVTQARKVVFERVKGMLKSSPFFTEQFPFDPKITSELVFEGGKFRLFPAAANEGGTVGYDAWGAVIDECNFMSLVESSSVNRGGQYDQAEYVSTLLERRIKSRFNRGGKYPGLLLHASSSKYPDDFTERRAKAVAIDLKKHQEAKVQVQAGKLTAAEVPENPRAFVRRYSQWETKPREWFSPESFYLYLGKMGERPFITKDAEEIAPYQEAEPDRVVEVPMDYWNDFHSNLDGAIRDIAGYPTLSIKPFLPQMDKVMEAIERGKAHGISHPFTALETDLEDGTAFLSEVLKFDQSKRYFAHVDLSKGKKDKAGLAIGHVRTWREVPRVLPDGTMVKDVMPVIQIDAMLRLVAPTGGELQIDYVRGLLLQLRDMGCNLHTVSFDQWQSLSTQQALKRVGINAVELSVDRTMEPYNALKEAFIEDRILLYSHPVLVEELSRLEHNEAKDKVDHPPKGGKDLSDAVAGVAYHCTTVQQVPIIDPSYGEFLDEPSVPSRWENPARGMEPTHDPRTGRLRPGQRVRTVDEWLFGDESGDPPIGFA